MMRESIVKLELLVIDKFSDAIYFILAFMDSDCWVYTRNAINFT